MDAEGLKSIGSLLLWGGLFYVMMRYGCGAHMIGGHHHGGQGNTMDGDGKDPVCGMSVSAQSASAASVRGGRAYYFCSTSCRDKFELAPEKYAGVAAPGSISTEGIALGKLYWRDVGLASDVF